MRLRFKQIATRTLTLILWLAVAYNLYFQRIATTKNRTVETAQEALPISDDHIITRKNNSTFSVPTSRRNTSPLERLQPTTEPRSRRNTSLLEPLQPTKKFTSESLSMRPNASKSFIGRRKPTAAKRNSSSSSANSTSAPEKPKRDKMDEYSDMGGIVFKHSNESRPVNPHPFHYILNTEKTCDVGPSSELFLLVYVHTRPDSIKQRELIRSTWGDVTNYDVTVRRIFVMGISESEYVQDSVKLESSLYHDIVQEDFLDSYRNLTYKAVGALRWVTNYCSNAKFVLKTDDDAFISMHVLLELLISKHKTGNYGPRSLLCNVCYGHFVLRSGKWAVTYAQRRHPKWPNFCQGLAYIMTPSVAADLYNASFDVPFLWMDDVYVTGFLAKKIGIVQTEINQHFFKVEQIEKQLNDTELWKNVLFSHIHDIDRRRWAWNRIMELRKNSSSMPIVHVGSPGFPASSTTSSAKTVISIKVSSPTKSSSTRDVLPTESPVLPVKAHLLTTRSTKALVPIKQPLPTASSKRAATTK